MATLYIINKLEGDTTFSHLVHGHQGAASSLPTVPQSLIVDGNVVDRSGALADATSLGIWATNDTPNLFTYLWVWTSVAAIVEIISASGGYRMQTVAQVPFIVMPTTTTDFTTTAITADPTTESVTDVNLWNHSGDSLNYHYIVVD